jgi:hypothetical protein
MGRKEQDMKKEDFIFGLYFGLAISLIIIFGIGAI